MTHQPKKPNLTIDYEAYEHFLEHSDASDTEKRELLDAIWNVVCEAITIGFNVHPVQQAMASQNCGQLGESSSQPTLKNHGAVESEHRAIQTEGATSL